MICGLDLSSTCCGFAFSEERRVMSAGFIDISEIETNKDKALHIASILENNIYHKQTTWVNLEAPLLGFGGHKTSQQTIIKLIRCNAITEYILGERWDNMKINLVNVNTTRKNVFGKCRTKGISSKEFVKNNLETILLDLHKWDKLTSRGNWDKRNFDTYDAIVLSFFK